MSDEKSRLSKFIHQNRYEASILGFVVGFDKSLAKRDVVFVGNAFATTGKGIYKGLAAAGRGVTGAGKGFLSGVKTAKDATQPEKQPAT